MRRGVPGSQHAQPYDRAMSCMSCQLHGVPRSQGAQLYARVMKHGVTGYQNKDPYDQLHTM